MVATKLSSKKLKTTITKKQATPAVDFSNKEQLTISEALRDPDNVLYVLNTSNLAGGKRSDVLLDIRVNNAADSTLVAVPDSWLPFDVTALVAKSDALSSVSFRQAIQSGILVILPTAKAKAILTNDLEGVTGERRRLNMRGKDADESSDEQTPGIEDAIENKVDPQVVTIMNQTMGPKDRLAVIRNIAESLGELDMKYIISKADKTETRLLQFIENIRDKQRRGR